MDSPAENRSPAHIVVLRLRLEDELPIGHAIAHDGCEQAFTGWLGLIGAIQTLIVDEGAGSAGRDLDPGSHGV